jgi:putative spermidine/putrescine transport system ATP-binding protein
MLDGGLVESAGRRLPVDGERPKPGTKVKVLLRPEALGLEPLEGVKAAAGTVGPNAVGLDTVGLNAVGLNTVHETGTSEGTVRIATFLGSVTRLTIALGDGTEVKADLPSHRAAQFPAGIRVRVVPAPRPVLVLPN